MAGIQETATEEAAPREEADSAKDEEVTPKCEVVKKNTVPEVEDISSPIASTAEDADNEDDEDDEDQEEEEAIVHEVHQATAPQVITRARVVQVAKLVPPKLPARNPGRNRTSVHSDISVDTSRDATASPSTTVEKQSPDSTPSLMRSDSTSTFSSVEADRLEQIGNKLKPKYSNEPVSEQKDLDDSKDAFHSLPESPIKSIPGGFE